MTKKTTKTTKQSTKTVNLAKGVEETVTKQEVAIAVVQRFLAIDVIVSKIWYQGDNVARFSIDLADIIEKSGKVVHNYVNCVWFDPQATLEEGDVVTVDGRLFYDKYEGMNATSYSLAIKVDEVH